MDGQRQEQGGDEINFTKYKSLHLLQDIKKDILALEAETEGRLKEIMED